MVSEEKPRYTVPVYNGCADLRPVWFTERGYWFLRDSGAWMFCDEKELDRIVGLAKDEGVVIRKKTVSPGTPLRLPKPKRNLLRWVRGQI